MNDVSVRFGVDLKAPEKPDPKDNPSDGKVDRAKASIFAWDDEGLQKTKIVTKKIAKAATVLQRFIRACISHWKYYNEYRIPLLEELEDAKRRHQEELIEVKEFKMRGFEEARYEVEAELAMPKEQFEALQKTKNDLKQEIKDEEEATVQLEKEMGEEKHATKMLERARHEIEAQHTLSRLDVEIPALEAEHVELAEVDAEFSGIVGALQSQLDDMNAQIAIEKKHKTRLMKCLAKIVQMLEARGAKAKIINSVKMSIKYKGEDPPPKPAPPPAPEPEPTPEPPAAPEESAAVAEPAIRAEETAEPAEPSESTSAEESQQASIQILDAPTDGNAVVESSISNFEEDVFKASGSETEQVTSSKPKKTIKSQKSFEKEKSGSESSFDWEAMMQKEHDTSHSQDDDEEEEKTKAPKRTKSSEKSSKRRGRSKNDFEASFDWSKEQRNRENKESGKAERRKSRSLSPVKRNKKKSSKGSRDDSGTSRSKSQDESKPKSTKMLPRRSVSTDIMDGIADIAAMRKAKNEKAIFDWANMSMKSEVKSSKKRSPRKGKRGDNDLAKQGHSSYAYGDNG